MRYILLLFICFSLAACQPDRQRQDGAQVDAVYINGVIWTGTTTNGRSNSVMAVKDGQVVFVGDKLISLIERPKKGEGLIDLEGRFVMPGFMDNHVHFMEGGAALASMDLRDANTQADFSDRIIRYATTKPKGRWVLNGNWDHTLWGGELPHKNWIDQGTPDTPVYVIRIDGHMALANSIALKAANITRDTPDPNGGLIMKPKIMP